MGNRIPRPQWIEYKDMPEDQERLHLREAIRIHTEVTGERPSAGTRAAAP